MILDMIQGCRYLRRSTDRWTLSKNSTTRQRTQGFGVKPVCIENVFDYNYIHLRFIFIPCHGMTSNGLRAQYLIPNLSLSVIAYPSIRPFRSGHVITQSRKISANNLPAKRKQIADRGLLCRIFLKKPSFFRTDFFTELGPQIRLLPIPNSGVNICPFNYGIKVILFQNWLQSPTSSNWICPTPILLFAIHWSLRPDPNPRSSFSQAQIPNGRSKSSCSSKYHPRELHSALSFRFYLRFLLRLVLTGAFHRAFDSHWGQFDVLLPRSCGNFWPSRVYRSRIPKSSFQSSFIQALSVARCFQDLAFAPNCRLEKLVQKGPCG
jgi:hypothetical protein